MRPTNCSLSQRDFGENESKREKKKSKRKETADFFGKVELHVGDQNHGHKNRGETVKFSPYYWILALACILKILQTIA